MFFTRKILRNEVNVILLQCVFHSIRFKVNKRLEYGGTPFFVCLPHPCLAFAQLSRVKQGVKKGSKKRD